MSSFEIAQFIFLGVTMVGVLFTVYNHFRNPDVTNASNIKVIQELMDFLKKTQEEQKNHLNKLEDKVYVIETNHLKHVQDSLFDVEKKITKVITILEERDFTKNNK